MWDYDVYLNSDLDVEGEFMGDGKQHLKTYINAIHQADKAIGSLISYYEQENIPAVILVLGDHQPGLPEFRQEASIELLKSKYPDLIIRDRIHLRRVIRKKALKEDYDFYKKNHQVPFLVWSNINSEFKSTHTSMNILPAILLEQAGIGKSVLYNLLSGLYKNHQELSKKTVVNEPKKQSIIDYEMLQYDIMVGENHYLKNSTK